MADRKKVSAMPPKELQRLLRQTWHLDSQHPRRRAAHALKELLDLSVNGCDFDTEAAPLIDELQEIVAEMGWPPLTLRQRVAHRTQRIARWMLGIKGEADD
jgi:hypothetical protein